MNYTYDEYYIESTKTCNLGELSVFICSILLSFGGFVSIIASSVRRSRCQDINCCGIFNCKRTLVNDENPEI